MTNLFPEQAVPAKIDPYDPEPEREKVRGRITFATTIVFGLVLMTYLLGALLVSDPR